MADTKTSALPAAAPLVLTDQVMVERAATSNHRATIQQIQDLLANVLQTQALAAVLGSTYSTVQHMQNFTNSAGIVSGGTITDDLDGTITVSAGHGFIRATDSPTAELLFTKWDLESGVNVALVDPGMNFVYVEYNAGSPRVVATAVKRTDNNTNIFLGSLHRNGTSIHITDHTGSVVGDHALNMLTRLKETQPFQRVSGGVITETGTRNLKVSAGAWWDALSRFVTLEKNTSLADTFSAYYRDGATGFTEITAQTQYSNTQYDNDSGILATLTAGKYGVHWVYLGQDSDFYLLFGRGDYNLKDAKEADTPGDVPPHFAESHTRLIGKIIVGHGDAVATEILSSFDLTLSTSAATMHSGLLGLNNVADHPGYVTLDGTRPLTGSWDVGDHDLTARVLTGEALALEDDNGVYETRKETDADPNEKSWRKRIVDGVMYDELMTDAGGLGTIWRTVDRSFHTAAEIAYNANISVLGSLNLRNTLNVASASALPVTSQGNFWNVTGTNDINSINSIAIGAWVVLFFQDDLTLTHHATDLILPEGSNIEASAGGIGVFYEYATGDWKCLGYTGGKPQSSPVKAEVGTSYAPILSDVGKTITLTNVAGILVTIPANASVAFPIDSEIHLAQRDVGAVTVGITTDTLNVNPNLTKVLNGRYAYATIKKISATEWDIFGNLVPA